MKNLLLLLMLLVTFKLSAQYGEDLVYKKKIDDWSNSLEAKKDKKVNSFTKNNVTYTYWLVDGKLFHFETKKTKQDQEWIYESGYSFYQKDQKLVHSFEYDTVTKINDKDNVSGWNCQMYFLGKNVKYITSLGHGKTEDDNYDLEGETIKKFNEVRKTIEDYRKNWVKK